MEEKGKGKERWRQEGRRMKGRGEAGCQEGAVGGGREGKGRGRGRVE